ncbi:uncharacterized protein LOC132551374 [Ylistrum balloti]|uniref:uncharacterized protein LOC132551374 n=1 Tax=Ylistrum balloti TaxID=509963 RepID=UPI002905C739|nr:uncharacterized protein LOC132551374 [Ylistrum balloti]
MATLLKHRALLGLSVLAVLLVIGAFTSPGWFRIHYLSFGSGDGWEDHLVEDGPIAMAKREGELGRKRHKHHHHHHHGDDNALLPEDKFVSISAGLWYFVTCVKYIGEDMEEHHKCHHSSYCHARREVDRLPEELRGIGLESIYRNAGDIARFGLLEFQVEAAIGMVCAIIGMIAGFQYVRGQFTKRCAGLVTFIFHLVSGVLFAVIFGNAVGMYKIGMLALSQVYGYDMNSPYLYLAAPYSLLMVAVASIVILGNSLVFLLILSKGPRKHIDLISAQGKGPGVPFGMISPPGYKPFPGLGDRPSFKEEDPLQEKVPL